MANAANYGGQEFNSASNPNYIGPIRKRAGYNLPRGNNPPTQVGFTPAKSPLPGFHPGLSGVSGVPSRIDLPDQRFRMHNRNAGAVFHLIGYVPTRAQILTALLHLIIRIASLGQATIPRHARGEANHVNF